MTDDSQFSVPNISIAGAPTIEWKFEGDVGTAEYQGATLRAEAVSDRKADLTLKNATGEVIADVVVRRMTSDESLAVSVMNIGTALMWSHIRWLDAQSVTRSSDQVADVARAAPVDFRNRLRETADQPEAAGARIAELEAELTTLRAAKAADAERVRSAVLEAIESVRRDMAIRFHDIDRAIAIRVAEQLASPVPRDELAR